LARWSVLPRVIDTEIENLRDGVKSGYTAPKLNARIVIDQVRTLAATTLKDSPFGSPVQRDNDPTFKKAFSALVSDQIVPAAKRYADFLEKDYLPAAREAIAVSANPNGAICYDASVLYHSSVSKTAKEVHEIGVQQVALLDAGRRLASVPSRSLRCRGFCITSGPIRNTGSRVVRRRSHIRRPLSRAPRRRFRHGSVCYRRPTWSFSRIRSSAKRTRQTNTTRPRRMGADRPCFS
jgi:hypothetical protein